MCVSDVCMDARKREKEAKSSGSKSASQHFIPLHSFLSSLGGSYYIYKREKKRKKKYTVSVI